MCDACAFLHVYTNPVCRVSIWGPEHMMTSGRLPHARYFICGQALSQRTDSAPLASQLAPSLALKVRTGSESTHPPGILVDAPVLTLKCLTLSSPIHLPSPEHSLGEQLQTLSIIFCREYVSHLQIPQKPLS